MPGRNGACIVRWARDPSTHALRILVRPADGSNPRLFTDAESAFLHLETLMAGKVIGDGERSSLAGGGQADGEC
ncbi:MAG: hypothetical protein KF753_06680 [Caldilineaceae bacterium]|nr:hypothetical protein [Caldilineaceae bacterium]